MLPAKHISLLIANGKRAKEWELGLKHAGFHAQCISTSGSDGAKGDYWLAVPSDERVFAQKFVTRVLAGEQTLPKLSPIQGPLLWGAGVIVFGMFAFFVAALIFR